MKLGLPPINKPCGHQTHVGTCPACQRAAATHQRHLLAQVTK